MELINRKNSISGLLFYISFAIYIGYQALMGSTLDLNSIVNIKVFIYLTCIILLLFKIVFFDQLTLNLLVNGTILMGISLIVSYVSKTNLYMLAAFIITSYNVPMKKIIKVYTFEMILFMLILFFFSYKGWILNFTYIREGIIRNSFGTSYPTDFAAHIFYIILGYDYLKNGRVRFIGLIIHVIIGCLILRFTDARLDAVLIMMLGIVMWLYTLVDKNKLSFIFNKLYLSPIIGGIFINLITYIYSSNNAFLEKLNELLSGRLYYGNLAYLKYPIKLLGNYIIQQGWGGVGRLSFSFKYFFIDSSFVNLILSYGILFTVYLISILTWSLKKAAIDYKITFLICFAFVSLSSIIDQHFLELFYNPFILVTFAAFHRKNKTYVNLSTKDQTLNV